MKKRLGRKTAFPEKGIALIIVLWMMVLLIVLVLAFSALVRSDVFATLTMRDQQENKYLAEAGLQKAMLEILYRNTFKDKELQSDETGVCPTDGAFRTGNLEKGSYRFAVTDESGKININLLTDATAPLLNNLLVNLGVEKNQADTIVDSILDWKDGDDLRRLHGAESEYYLSLPNPYKAKDANFDNLEELLLVQGMTQDILYGTNEKPGLIRYLTLYSTSTKININAAKRQVLKAIPSMTDEMVQTILNYRTSDNTKKDGSGLQTMLSAANYATIANYVTTADSNTFTVEVIGFREGKTGGYPIRAVVVAEGTDHCRIAQYQSPAHVEMPKDENIQKPLE